MYIRTRDTLPRTFWKWPPSTVTNPSERERERLGFWLYSRTKIMMISLANYYSRTSLRGGYTPTYYVSAHRYMNTIMVSSIHMFHQKLLHFSVAPPSSSAIHPIRSLSSYITANFTNLHGFINTINTRHNSNSSSSSNSVTTGGQPSPKKERRTRPVITPYTTKEEMKKISSSSTTASSTTTTYAYSTPPIPIPDLHQHDSVDDYLKKSSLSPWVPTPDPVARRMLQLADTSAEDIHCDLGCGDGRVNSIALQHFHVMRTIGIDNDLQLLKMARDRLLTIGYSCRYFNHHDDNNNENTDMTNPRDELLTLGDTSNETHYSSFDSVQFPAKVDLIYADLMMYFNHYQPNVGQDNNERHIIKDRYDIFSECTVLTMFFVEETLEKLRPTLEERFKGSGCRIITNGYAIPGWKPDWVEPILDLKIHLYDMSKGCTF